MMCSIQRSAENIIHLPLENEIDENKSLAKYLLEGFEKHKDKIAQVNAEDGRTETFGELLKRTISLAQAFRSRGITSDDIISICCYNNMDYIVVYMASVFIGARFSALDISAAPNELLHCLKMISPKLMFCEEEIQNLMESCMKEAGILCEIIVFDQSDKFISMDNFIQKYKSAEEFEINKTKTMKDTGCIAFTSGTSGLSKGAQLSNYGLYYGSLLVHKRTITNNDNILIFTLPYWITNVSTCFLSIILGTQRIILRKYHIIKLMKAFQDYKVNRTLWNQHTMNNIIDNQNSSDYDLSNLKIAYFTGSKISYNQIKNLATVLPHTKLLNGYGMTEVGGFSLLPNLELLVDKNENISVGSPMPGFYYKIVDPDTEESLGPNKLGELRFRYKGIMNGYLYQPEATAQTLDKNGFFRTGDIMYYDENYNFFLVDRLKAIFKFRGYHVSPSYIENALMQMEDVKECIVISKPHERDGELPMAVIILQKNAKITEEDIIKHIEDSLSDIHHLRGGVKFVDSIPKTSTGKPIIRDLKKIIFNKK